MNGLPQSVEVTLYIHAWPEASGGGYHVSVCDMPMDGTNGWVQLGTCTLSVPVPQVDARARMAEMLRAEKQRVLAAAQIKANEIDEKIQSLLALEHKGEELA